MEEKFINLPISVRWLLTALSWALTVVGFLGTIILKNYHSIFIVEILLTCVGIFFCIVAICLTIFMFTHNKNNKDDEFYDQKFMETADKTDN